MPKRTRIATGKSSLAELAGGSVRFAYDEIRPRANARLVASTQRRLWHGMRPGL